MQLRTSTHHRHSQKLGFTLVELAVVLVIFGGIAGMAVMLGQQWLVREKITGTQRTLHTIEMALETYLAANGRLPCPSDITHTASDSEYGYEAYESGDSDGTCHGEAGINASDATGGASYGAVPAQTLGLPTSVMRDQWGNLIVYYITDIATQKGSFFDKPAHSNYIARNATIGALTINDINGSAITSDALLALVSHGANQHGGYAASGTRRKATSPSSDELENCNCNSSAAAGTINATLVTRLPDETFDDIIRYMIRRNLKH